MSDQAEALRGATLEGNAAVGALLSSARPFREASPEQARQGLPRVAQPPVLAHRVARSIPGQVHDIRAIHAFTNLPGPAGELANDRAHRFIAPCWS